MIIYKTKDFWLHRLLSAWIGLLDYFIWSLTMGWILPNLEEKFTQWYYVKKHN